LEKCLISDTVPLILKEDLKEFIVLVPTYEVIHLTLDYLAHDTELHELSAYNFNISGFHIIVLFNLSEEKVHIPSNTTK
jgi:hypothetical protein